MIVIRACGIECCCGTI